MGHVTHVHKSRQHASLNGISWSEIVPFTSLVERLGAADPSQEFQLGNQGIPVNPKERSFLQNPGIRQNRKTLKYKPGTSEKEFKNTGNWNFHKDYKNPGKPGGFSRILEIGIKVEIHKNTRQMVC